MGPNVHRGDRGSIRVVHNVLDGGRDGRDGRELFLLRICGVEKMGEGEGKGKRERKAACKSVQTSNTAGEILKGKYFERAENSQK